MHTDCYQPEVNDYVIWDKNEYGIDKGWVYFVCPELEDKVGFTKHTRYITIETSIKPRPVCDTEAQLQGKIHIPKHKYIHTLLLCYEHDWHQLKYIKSRPDCKSKSYYNRFQIDDTK